MSDLEQILHNRNSWHSPTSNSLKPVQARSCWNKTGSMITNSCICQTLVRALPWIEFTFRSFQATNRCTTSTQKTPNLMSTVTKISNKAAFANSLPWEITQSISRATAWNRHKELIPTLPFKIAFTTANSSNLRCIIEDYPTPWLSKILWVCKIRKNIKWLNIWLYQTPPFKITLSLLPSLQ